MFFFRLNLDLHKSFPQVEIGESTTIDAGIPPSSPFGAIEDELADEVSVAKVASAEHSIIVRGQLRRGSSHDEIGYNQNIRLKKTKYVKIYMCIKV